jgi:hypothetical protein
MSEVRFLVPNMDCATEKEIITHRRHVDIRQRLLHLQRDPLGAAGSDTALETADVALMSDDLRGVPVFLELSKRTASTLRANIAFAIGVKAIFFVLGLFGVATLWMAVFADLGASLVVAANGLRLLKA